MSIAGALALFRDLKREGALRDFMLSGSVAAAVHTEPFYTQDVDVAVAVRSDAEYLSLFRLLSHYGRVAGHAIVIDGTPVEVFPADISPVVHDALATARRKRVGRLLVKVASAEHLLVESLRVWRPKDRYRAGLLLPHTDGRKVAALLRRFDRDGTLARRYQAVSREID